MSAYVSVTGNLVFPDSGDDSITVGEPQLGLGTTANPGTGVSGILVGHWSDRTNLDLSGNTDPPPSILATNDLWSSGAGTAEAAPGSADTVPAKQTSILSAIQGLGKYGSSLTTALFAPKAYSASSVPGQPLVPVSQPRGAQSNTQLWVVLVLIGAAALLILHGGNS